MYTVNNFCCCCNLRTGGVTLGWLSLVWSVLKLAISIFGVMRTNLIYPETINEEIVSSNVYKITLIFLIVMSAITFITSILLLVGTIKKMAVLLIPYMVSCVIDIVAEIFMNILEWVFVEENPDQFGWIEFFNVVASILFIVLECYLLLCIYSLYKLIQKNIPNPSVVLKQRGDDATLAYSAMG